MVTRILIFFILNNFFFSFASALIPNSTIRSMFEVKKLEPAQVKMFQLRLVNIR